MRTTLTLENDVAASLERLRSESGDSLKAIVNRVMRAGLRHLETKPEVKKSFQTRAVSLGACRIGDVVDISEALALAEGDDFK
jgi:hypothetical protein